MFKPAFADAVKAGKKTRTVRPLPKRMPVPGDVIDCRVWDGRPYNSRQVKLCEGAITRVNHVEIGESGIRVGPAPGQLSALSAEMVEQFARADGFDDFNEMLAWFEAEHGSLPFAGIVIAWEITRREP